MMSTPVLPTRPRFIDYLFLLVGVMLSALLGALSELRVDSASTNPWLVAWAQLFAIFLFLPVGIILLWPIFFTTQKILGRPQGLTSAEWLLGLAWLAAVALTAWIAWKASGTAPEAFSSAGFKQTVVLVYVLFTLSMGAISVVLLLVGLVGRWSQPWTHTLALALFMWPALPLLLLWVLDLKLE
jgi:Na+/proline symporter